MKLRLNFLNNNYILIHVFEENVAWFKLFQNLKNNNQYFPTIQTSQIAFYNNNTLMKIMYYLNFFKSCELDSWLEIIKNTEYLKSQNFQLPFKLPRKFNFSQELLNTIHRFFTYNSTWAMENCDRDMTGKTPILPSTPNPFDSSFVPTDTLKFLTAISNLNMAVHKLESSCMTNNKQSVLNIIKNNKIFWIHPRSNFDYTSNGWFHVGAILDEFQKSYINSYPNVIMSEEIQGKSYLRAFIDNDDPTKLDVTGRYGSYGGFFIDTNNDRKTIYESQEFKDWLDQYNLKKEDLLLEWPLGQVTDSSLELKRFSQSDFIDIDFIDD
jgi:hypothetical protein